MPKGPGKQFEKDFIGSVPKRCDITRLKDGAGWSDASNVRFTSNNPCDFIVWSAKTKRMYKFELKSIQGKSLPFANIKQHQLDSLCDSRNKGVWSLFVVNYRAVEETYLVKPETIEACMENGVRKSLSLAEARESGIKVKQTLKRIHWGYDLEWL